MNDAFDDLLRAMKRAGDALYNGFEPLRRLYQSSTTPNRIALEVIILNYLRKVG